MDKLQAIIDAQVRPVLQGHGGDIELVELTADGVLKVRLKGACAGCPGAQMTLADVVTAALREAAPAVREVVPVFEADEDLVRQALAILRKGRESRDG